jgi:hypothetical protein
MFTFIRLSALVMLTCSLHAAETAPVDPDLPQPFNFDTKALDTFRAHSPFNRVVSLQDTYKLTGVAYFNGKPMATLMNKETKQHFVVSEETNALGMTLTEATMSDDPEKTLVHVMIGPEEVVMHYSEAEAAAASAKAGKGDSSSNSKHGSSSSHSHSAPPPGFDLAAVLGDQGKDMLKSLSPENREKLAAIVASSAERHPERSKEELANVAQKILAKMKSSEDKAQTKAQTGGTPKPPKSEKPKKR